MGREGGGVGCFNIEKTIIRVLAYSKKIKLFFGVENADFYCIINLYSDGNEGTADENIWSSHLIDWVDVYLREN